MEGNGNSNGGGVPKEAISKEWGVASQGLFSWVPSKIGKLLKTNSRSVKQAFS